MHAYNTPHFHFCQSPDSKTEPSYNKQTCGLLINELCLVSILGRQTPIQSQKSLYCQKWRPYKVRAVFSEPICTNKARIGPPSANQGISTDSHNSQHVQVTLRVTPPTSPCPTLSADAEPARKCAETIFSVHCAVWRQQKLTLGIKGISGWVLYTQTHWKYFTCS